MSVFVSVCVRARWRSQPPGSVVHLGFRRPGRQPVTAVRIRREGPAAQLDQSLSALKGALTAIRRSLEPPPPARVPRVGLLRLLLIGGLGVRVSVVFWC